MLPKAARKALKTPDTQKKSTDSGEDTSTTGEGTPTTSPQGAAETKTIGSGIRKLIKHILITGPSEFNQFLLAREQRKASTDGDKAQVKIAEQQTKQAQVEVEKIKAETKAAQTADNKKFTRNKKWVGKRVFDLIEPPTGALPTTPETPITPGAPAPAPETGTPPPLPITEARTTSTPSIGEISVADATALFETEKQQLKEIEEEYDTVKKELEDALNIAGTKVNDLSDAETVLSEKELKLTEKEEELITKQTALDTHSTNKVFIRGAAKQARSTAKQERDDAANARDQALAAKDKVKKDRDDIKRFTKGLELAEQALPDARVDKGKAEFRMKRALAKLTGDTEPTLADFLPS